MIELKEPLEFVWNTEDPFLFCVHHQDNFPPGNGQLGPIENIEDRHLGNDFEMNNAWRMYHGKKVPGFPRHPHRGFETVTVTLDGYVDHFDSSGAKGRYGNGDVQWMTAGKGMEHCEMFPLLNEESNNPLHLFQIWLNLPGKSKMVAPYYQMLWQEDIPVIAIGGARISVITGKFHQTINRIAATDSWAYKHRVDILLIEMQEQSHFTLPEIPEDWHRNLYFYEGNTLAMDDQVVEAGYRYKLSNHEMTFASKKGAGKLLLLQGMPIEEPVAKSGPFVMNTEEELKQAYLDYKANLFGHWPWTSQEPTNEKHSGRFASFPDGTILYPPK